MAKFSKSSLVGGIDDADAFERNVQFLGDRLDFGRVAEHDGRAEPQRVKLPRRLQDARLLAFGKHHPLGMPLQFFDDVADETHDDRLAADNEIVKSICQRCRVPDSRERGLSQTAARQSCRCCGTVIICL